MTENEVALFAIPFGKISFLMMMKRSNQVLIEMETIDDAMAMINYYTEFPFVINDKTIGFQYSVHGQLETSFDSKAANAAVSNANKIVEVDLPKAKTGKPLTALRVVIDMLMDESINHLVIYKVFHRFGKINRIIIFNKNNTMNCLIEFSRFVEAFVALLHLNGQCIFKNSCNMQIEFSSKEGPLEVRNENDKCRDYVSHPLTKEEKNDLANLGKYEPPSPPHRSSYSSSNNDGPYASPARGGLINSLANHLSSLAQQTGINLTPEAVNATANFMALSSNKQRNDSINYRRPMYDTSPKMSMHSFMKPMSHMDEMDSSPVLIVSGLDEQRISPDALFTLFGVYGDVIKVKILFNKLDTALIQFVNPLQARTAMNNISGSLLWGRVLKVHSSKHTSLRLASPKEPNQRSLNQDYTDSKLHRFRKPNSKNFSNIYPPSKTLHLSNIPDSFTKDDLMDIFDKYNLKPMEINFMSRDKKMALAIMDSQDEASQALIALHNYPLSDAAHLRVSFSRMNS